MTALPAFPTQCICHDPGATLLPRGHNSGMDKRRNDVPWAHSPSHHISQEGWRQRVRGASSPGKVSSRMGNSQGGKTPASHSFWVDFPSLQTGVLEVPPYGLLGTEKVIALPRQVLNELPSGQVQKGLGSAGTHGAMPSWSWTDLMTPGWPHSYLLSLRRDVQRKLAVGTEDTQWTREPLCSPNKG